MAVALPNLPVERVRRRERAVGSDAPDDRPLVIVERQGAALRIVALDAAAEAAGARPGLPLTEARAIRPDLRVVSADAAADRALLTAVADWCDRYTPLVALDPPHGLLLDVAGCAHFFGGEAAMAQDVTEALARQGLTARVTVAGGAGVARALAWFTAGGVPTPEEERARLAALPVAALGPAEAVRTGLARAGLTTLGQLAARGRGELVARFGSGLVAALDQALGRVDPPISPRRPAPVRMIERRFPEPVLTQDAVVAACRALAGALAGRLEAAGEGVTRVEAAFFRADGKVSRISVATGRPTRNPEMLLRLLRERLDALADPIDPGFGFDLVRLSALAVEPLAPEAVSLDPGAAEEGAVAELVDRLAARHGRRRVLRFLAGDVHRPEGEARARPAQAMSAGGGRSAARAASWPAPSLAEPPRRPLRLFADPEPIEVLAEVPDGPPIRFLWRRVAHAVARAEGPERIALEWWRRDPGALTRDYFRVEDAEGARFWLYRDGLYVREAEHPRWFLHGLFG
ncbi:DNA polymerase Y family protein [Methylopila sp. 73B]|uniref:Y-family DNA polymerase n=1 Tax=Methylopila sp. 73B TaxID=1120792 RepID=UPI00038258F7|nr:DNA polymerase Y family protein [Methylopila sp. 73B]